MLATALAAVTFPLHAQQAACPAAVTAAVDSAWRLLRADSTARARPMFTRALTACPTLPDARVGLGFLVLRAGELTTADSLFRVTVAADARNADAWEGIATVAERRGQRDSAVAATRRVLQIAPAYESARSRMLRLAPDDGRPPVNKAARRYASLNLLMRTHG